jgi:uncharacterized FlaG/YvyC family protein
MDVKGIAKIINPITIHGKDRVDKSIRSDNTQEREGNGQMPTGEDSEQKGSMNEEQFQQALDHLKKHQIFKDHQLEIQIQFISEKRFVIIKESNGKILRRIPESELWSLIHSKDSDKGQLLSKTA